MFTTHSCSLTLLCIALMASSVGWAQGDSRRPKVDEIFHEWDRQDTPGCAVGIGRNGRVLYTQGYGIANLDHGIPITPGTVFDVGSVSKQFTAAAVATLALDGRLGLDDQVQRYVPQLPRYDPPITIRHLIHHTSGVRDVWAVMGLAGLRDENVYTESEIVYMIARQLKLNFTPGDEHLYSNSGYLLLAAIVRQVTGKSLGDYAAEVLFEPLGLRQTFFYEDRTRVIQNRAIGYSPREAGGYRVNHYYNFDVAGDGQLYTTVEDLLYWGQSLDDPAVGRADLKELLHRRGTLNNGDTLNYAFGLVHGEHRGLTTVGHGGAWGGFRAMLLRFPQQRLAVAITCNLGSVNPTRLAERVAEVYLDDLPALAADRRFGETTLTTPVLSRSELERVAGHYWDETTSTSSRIFMEDNRLWFGGLGMSPVGLAAVAAGRFVTVNAPVAIRIHFEPAMSGRTETMRVIIEGGTPRVYERYEPATPAPARLRALAGRYYSEELETTYELRLEADTLRLYYPGVEGAPLVPVHEGTFQARGFMTLRFGDPGRQVTGFKLAAGRVRNVTFVRR